MVDKSNCRDSVSKSIKSVFEVGQYRIEVAIRGNILSQHFYLDEPHHKGIQKTHLQTDGACQIDNFFMWSSEDGIKNVCQLRDENEVLGCFISLVINKQKSGDNNKSQIEDGRHIYSHFAVLTKIDANIRIFLGKRKIDGMGY